MKIMRAITDQTAIARMAESLRRTHPRLALLWNLGTSTGLRISDMLRLKIADIDKNGEISITESKTKNVRHIKLTQELKQDVNFLKLIYRMKLTHYLFFRNENQKEIPLSRQWAHRVIARTASRMALDSIGAHSMRKIYACNLFRSTGSVKSVQNELGHKHMSTTLIYLKDLLEKS